MFNYNHLRVISSIFVLLLSSVVARADQAGQPTATAGSPKTGTAPASLVVLFELGSSRIRQQDEAVLDRVSRVYNEGKPIVMEVAASSDTAGRAKANLLLSQRRAAAVLQGLLDRGLPAERFQLVAKGQTELAVPTGEGVREARNRRVVISWH